MCEFRLDPMLTSRSRAGAPERVLTRTLWLGSFLHDVHYSLAST